VTSVQKRWQIFLNVLVEHSLVHTRTADRAQAPGLADCALRWRLFERPPSRNRECPYGMVDDFWPRYRAHVGRAVQYLLPVISSPGTAVPLLEYDVVTYAALLAAHINGIRPCADFAPDLGKGMGPTRAVE